MKTLNTESGLVKPGASLKLDQPPTERSAMAVPPLRIGDWKWLFLAVLLLVPSLLFAQSYSIDWYKISSGGGTSTGGAYSVSGTIGQHDAGGPMTGGNYSLNGGFWALYAVQTPGAPVLSIKLTTTNTIMVYWNSPAAGYNLQGSTSLAATNWFTPAETVTDNGTVKYIIVNPPTGNRFYRLISP